MAIHSPTTLPHIPNQCGKNQHGGVLAVLLYPLAFLGLVTVILMIVAMLYYQPSDKADTDSKVLVAGSSAKTLSPGLQATFDRSCAICHSQPATGAPTSGNTAAWQPRLAQGMDSLLEHTIAGHNGMPPMGLCMECSAPEFVAFIEFMTQLDSGLECAE